MSLADLAHGDWGDPADVYLDHAEPVTLHPEWHRYALCNGTMENGHSLWFSANASERRRARAICAACPVQTQCADAGRDQYGVWAGSDSVRVVA